MAPPPVRLTLDRGPLARKAARGVRVAIVDSGIAAGHPHVGPVAGGVCLICHEDRRADYGDRHGHGTAVAAVIREKAPEAELFAVRIFERMLATTAEVLAEAMRWAADHGVHLVNLSLGTPNEARRAILSEALDDAAKRGVLVVAAVESDGRAMFPGALPGAVGVRLDPECGRDELMAHDLAADVLRLAASGYPRPIPGVPPERNLYGISFAVANATGFLARLLEGRSAASSSKLAELIRSNGV